MSGATPFASPVVDETCEIPETFEADYEVVAADPVILQPGPGIGSGDPFDVLPVGTQVMYLCEMVPTSDPARDELDEGQMWVKPQTEMGTVGWMREINVSLASESSTPIIDHANEQAVPMGGDNRVTPVPTPSD